MTSTIHLDRDRGRMEELEGEIDRNRESMSQEEFRDWANETLIEYAEIGWCEGIELLLKTGLCDARHRGSSGKTPLLIAQQQLHVRVVSKLLEFILFDGDTPESCDIEDRVRNLDISSSAEDGFLAACWMGREEAVQQYVSSGTNPDCPPIEGFTPLMLSCLQGKATVCRALLEAGANVGARSPGGWTTLMCACKGHPVNVRHLLSHGADVNAATKDDGWTALMAASKYGDDEIVRLLIEAGADVNARDNDGFTALMFASGEGGDDERVRALIEAGAIVNARDNDGFTALMFASGEGGDDERVRALIEAGADVNARDNDGKTALMFASGEGGDDERVRALIEAGAIVNARDNDGFTALMFAAKYGNVARVRAFIEAGADVNAHDNGGGTALMVASTHGDVEGHLVVSRSTGSTGENYRDAKSPKSPYGREHISDMDRRQREILARQQQLLQEQRIADLEHLVSALKDDLGFQETRPVAAIVIFRSFVHWKVIQQDRGTIFGRVSEAIGRQIEACPDDNRKLGYWLTNTSALYYLMQRHTKIAGKNAITARLRLLCPQAPESLLATDASYLTRSPIKSGDGPDASAHGGTNGLPVQFEARYPALIFKQRLGVLVQEIFPSLRDNMKKEISGQLGFCMNISNTHGGRSAARRSAKNPHDSKNEHLLPWREILKSFTSLLDILKGEYVPHLLASKLMEQMFTIINVNLFNQLMLKRECCSLSNGEYVKLGLGEVEQWLENAGPEWVGNSWDSLSCLRQAVTFLVVHQKAKKSFNEIRRDLCSSLTVQQIYRLSTMYWDDRFGTESVSHEVLSELKIIMNSAGQQSQNHSFLLDEDPAIPFSTDELNRTYDGLNLLQAIQVPKELQQSDDERKDKFQFLTKNLITPSV